MDIYNHKVITIFLQTEMQKKTPISNKFTDCEIMKQGPEHSSSFADDFVPFIIYEFINKNYDTKIKYVLATLTKVKNLLKYNKCD